MEGWQSPAYRQAVGLIRKTGDQRGGVPERLKGAVLKTAMSERASKVRILPPPR